MINIKKMLTNIKNDVIVTYVESKTNKIQKREDFVMEDLKERKNVKERIKKVSGVLNTLVKVAKTICIVAIVILFVAIGWYMIAGDVDLLALNGNVVLHSPFDWGNRGGEMEVWEKIFVFVSIAVNLIFTERLLEQARMIFSDISEADTPFEFKHVERIKKIAIFFLVISCIDESTIGIDFTGIVGTGIIWLMAMIFEYGCELQQEHDETL